MVHLFGIYELANPLLSVMPLVLMVLSGYTIGIVISKVRKVNTIFLRDFIYGNVVLNFLFISGFMFFGVLTYEAKEFFTAFTYILVGLSILGVFHLLKKLIVNIVVGGVVTIGPDNNLYVTIGDLLGSRNINSSTKAQNFNNGTDPDGRAGILRIAQDGSPVQDGILGKKFRLNLYYAYGIRNSFGIDFDPLTGNLWDTENGPEYGDEINLVQPGFNSGWERIQGVWKPNRNGTPGHEVTSKDLPLVDFDGKGKYSSPEFIWKDASGVTAAKFLNSDKLGKKYENDLFVPSVTLGIIFHFDLNKDRTGLKLNGSLSDKIADDNRELDDKIFVQGLGGITDIDIGPDGYMYVLSNYMGKPTIFRIVPIQSSVPFK